MPVTQKMLSFAAAKNAKSSSPNWLCKIKNPITNQIKNRPKPNNMFFCLPSIVSYSITFYWLAQS